MSRSFLPYIFQVLYVLCFTRPRYQVSVYRSIGPLVCSMSSESCSLPPTKYALQKRTMCQPFGRDCQIGGPHDHGWNLKEGDLHFQWMDQEPAPKSLIERVSCKCICLTFNLVLYDK